MYSYSIAVGTITYAIKGRELLRDFGIKAAITRRTGQYGNSGCGYSIIIQGDINEAKKVLENADIKIHQINQI